MCQAMSEALGNIAVNKQKFLFFMLTYWWEETMNKRSEHTKCSIIVSTVEKSKTGKGAREW